MPRSPTSCDGDVIRYLPDTNVWLALALSGHPQHDLARRWWDGVEGRGSVLMCRATQQSVLRLLTTAAVFVPLGDQPLTNTEAWAVVDALAADDRVVTVSIEPSRTPLLWREYSSVPASAPKTWMDAYLAAFSRAADATLVTVDGAFRSYAELDLLLLGY